MDLADLLNAYKAVFVMCLASGSLLSLSVVTVVMHLVTYMLHDVTSYIHPVTAMLHDVASYIHPVREMLDVNVNQCQ